MSSMTPCLQASRANFTMLKSEFLSQILTIEAIVCQPSKLAIFRVTGVV